MREESNTNNKTPKYTEGRDSPKYTEMVNKMEAE